MKVLFVSSSNNQNRPSNIVIAQGESLKELGIEVEYFGIKNKGLKGYFKTIKNLKLFLKNKNYDVIHAHYALCGVVAYFTKSKEKLIVSLMGDDIIGIVNSKGIQTKKGKVLTSLNKLFCKYFFYATISKSKNIANALYKNTKTEIIPNGVNFEVFKPIDPTEAREKLNLNQTKKKILFATDPSRNEKNYELARAAVDNLKDTSIELLVVHNVNQYELNLYYNAVNIVLLTSFHEGSPNVIKEALACNAVIVSTDVGDVKEMFNQINNVFITPFDSYKLSEIITKAFEHENSNGREKIEYLNSQNIANRIIAIYNK